MLTPDINRSVMNFDAIPADRVPDDVSLAVGSPGAITFGLSAVRNVGRGRSSSSCSPNATRTASTTSFYDFAERVPEPVLNKRTVESLIKAGAFDRLGHPRRGLLGLVRADHRHHDRTSPRARPRRDEPVRRLGRRRRSDDSADPAGFDERIPIPDIEFDKGDKLKAEKEMLGLYVSDHPLFGVEAALKRKVEHALHRSRPRWRTARRSWSAA